MATPQHPDRLDQRCPGTLRRVGLLEDLAAAYPEVSGPGVAQILDRAYLAAKLGTGTVDERIVAVLARDRLEVLRARTAAARRSGSPAEAGGEPAGRTGGVEEHRITERAAGPVEAGSATDRRDTTSAATGQSSRATTSSPHPGPPR